MYAMFTLRNFIVASATAATLAALAATAEAKGSPTYFRASAETVRAGCSGTFMGTNKDGFYGCITKDDKQVVTCKNGKCVADTAGRKKPKGGSGSPSSGRGDHAGNAGQGNGGGSGGGSGSGGVNTGNANTSNAGASTGMGGGGTIN